MITFIQREFLRKKRNPRFTENENQLDSIIQSLVTLYALERGIN